MVGFWFNENELKAFDNALVKANYVKPNGTANRADYLKDMAKAVVDKFGTGADKRLFESDTKAAKPAKSKAKKAKAAKPAPVLAAKSVSVVAG